MSASKALKAIVITANSQDSHISIKVKNVLRWLKTGHEVKVQINGKADRHKHMDTIFKLIEKEVKTAAKINQKIIKPESIRFNVRPTEEAKNLVIDDKGEISQEEDLDALVSGKDILSDEFEKELEESLKSDSFRGGKN